MSSIAAVLPVVESLCRPKTSGVSRATAMRPVDSNFACMRKEIMVTRVITINMKEMTAHFRRKRMCQ